LHRSRACAVAQCARVSSANSRAVATTLAEHSSYGHSFPRLWTKHGMRPKVIVPTLAIQVLASSAGKGAGYRTIHDKYREVLMDMPELRPPIRLAFDGLGSCASTLIESLSIYHCRPETHG
jgi:hypothetical protein